MEQTVLVRAALVDGRGPGGGPGGAYGAQKARLGHIPRRKPDKDPDDPPG